MPLSAEYLLSRGRCCHNGCMNCPYGSDGMSKKNDYAVVAVPSKRLAELLEAERQIEALKAKGVTIDV